MCRFDREVITFRPNERRQLKTPPSQCSVPLWPQLRDILEHYLAERPPSRLLFPSYRTGEEAMLRGFRRLTVTRWCLSAPSRRSWVTGARPWSGRSTGTGGTCATSAHCGVPGRTARG